MSPVSTRSLAFGLSIAVATVAAAGARSQQATPAAGAPMHGAGAVPIDFAKVPRTIAREPAYVGAPAYGCFLFGLNGEIRMWAVLDRSKPDAPATDVLYLDRDADGDLTEPGERLQSEVDGRKEVGGELVGPTAVFAIGTIEVGGLKHTDFRLTVHPQRVGWKMRWRGEQVTMGGYAPDHAEYANFAPTVAAAPLYVPGYDRPFEFERWIREPLRRGQSTDFKVFLGQRGSQRGTFSCVDDQFLPAGEFVVATLICQVAGSKEERVRNELKERC